MLPVFLGQAVRESFGGGVVLGMVVTVFFAWGAAEVIVFMKDRSFEGGDACSIYYHPGGPTFGVSGVLRPKVKECERVMTCAWKRF